MMKIAIVGGKLQGTEAVYLAKEAGYFSTVIDINENVTASKLCNEFVCGDVIKRDANVLKALREADVILPAMENLDVINAIKEIAEEFDLLVAFDFEAYMITSSKKKSDELFHKNDIPSPKYYPRCEAPYIVKPVSESGSHGVMKIDDEVKLTEVLKENDELIAQEYLEGPSYSVEIIGNGKEYRTYTITQIHMDEVYDCCQVTALCKLTEEEDKAFRDIAVRIAKLINLKGIMDVEVIHARGEFKVLEIDARIPSQTPAVVLKSSGMNLLKELTELTINGKFVSEMTDKKRYAIYENYLMENLEISKEGEHIMTDARPLHMVKDKFGYEDVLWDYEGGDDFRGIFINSAKDEKEMYNKSIMLYELLKGDK